MRSLVLLFAAALAAVAQPPQLTMRVSFSHSGTASEESFALQKVAIEGAWPGPPDGWLDSSDLGKYFFQVTDQKSGKPLYSRGFASIYGEWETTDEARLVRRAFQESLRFPVPTGPVRVTVSKRNAQNRFNEVWATSVNPTDPLIDRAPSPKLTVWSVMRNGDPSSKVDLLLLGDGYTAAEMDKWHADARRLTETLFAAAPFKQHRADFNVWAIDTPSEESGVSQPSDAIYHRSPLGASYDAFGSERYILTMDDERLRQIAAAAPYEFIEIVTNTRKYGGGGIFNLYATVAADNAFTPYIFVHEFGHHFAGLADEYYTSETAYTASAKRVEPWEPNATADPKAAKWRELLSAGVETPTAWPKQEFEAEQKDTQARRRAIRANHRPEKEMEDLFAEERTKETRLLGSGPNAGKVGAFEGCAYEATGLYRPQQDCIMFTRDEVGFCAVCRRAIERVIQLYAR